MNKNLIKREDYLKQFDDYLDSDFIKVFTGIRRCGKTSLLFSMVDELKNKGINENNIVFISFEDPDYNSVDNSEELDKIVYDYVKDISGKIYLFFDEIQEVTNWEKSINGFRFKLDCDIYITGSNSKLMSAEFATLLTGRFVNIELYPFSFNEFLEYKQELNHSSAITNELNSDLENFFEEYQQYGGIPLTISSQYDKELVLNGICSSIILNDIVERYEIRNVGLFNRIVKYIIENTGNLISANAVYKYLKHEKLRITKSTIYNYLEYLENAYIIVKASKEDLLEKKRL